MGHLEILDAELRKLRDSLQAEMEDSDFETLAHFVKDKVLQSYVNGLKAKAADKQGADRKRFSERSS